MKKKTLRFRFALFVSKLTFYAMRLLKRNATHLPGAIALKLCPDFLAFIGKPGTIIAVTGTNGKTTVTNMIYTLLNKKCYDVICNRLGSNTYTGIAALLLSGASLFGRAKHSVALLEIDERSAPLIYPYVIPTYLICTNLFRDSLMRNAHPEFIKDILDKYIPPETTLILNADDLISGRLAPGNKRIYFGIDRQSFETEEQSDISCDLRVCPQCYTELTYDFRRYHHIGKVHCSSCGFCSAKSDYTVRYVDLDSMTAEISEPDGTVNTYSLPSRNMINIYNLLSAVTLARTLGIDAQEINSAGIKVVSTRYDEKSAGGVVIESILAKAQNPIACSRSFGYSAKLSGKKAVVLMLDEILDADKISENICWMYDTDFELLNRDDVIQVIAAGPRYLDNRVRLELAGIDSDKISVFPDYSSIANTVNTDCDRLFILYDLHAVEYAKKVRDEVAARLEGRTGGN